MRVGEQVSLTANTILHNTKTPLTVWFWAAYLMSTDTRGVSALLIQRQLALRRYETAWMMLHKFRRAMVNWGVNLVFQSMDYLLVAATCRPSPEGPPGCLPEPCNTPAQRLLDSAHDQ